LNHPYKSVVPLRGEAMSYFLDVRNKLHILFHEYGVKSPSLFVLARIMTPHDFNKHMQKVPVFLGRGGVGVVLY